MIQVQARCVLLDIEGTTSSVSFVYDVMFPFARRELEHYLAGHWGQPPLLTALAHMAADAGAASLEAWRGAGGAEAQRQRVVAEVHRLMDADAKQTGLKQLQGLIWEAGFASGELRAHVYEDVAPALRQWQSRGLDLRIYSSGSVAAQRLFFGHTIEGDLLPLFRGHYDTTIGSKRETASYQAIARDAAREPAEIVFVSDVVAELDAARAAGLQTVLCIRPGNAPAASHTHPEIHSFAELGL